MLDGRNRIEALARIRKLPPLDEWRLLGSSICKTLNDRQVDPWAYVISANVQRRHLTPSQKREIVAALLKAKPERSDRATAKIAKVDHQTVAAVREQVEANGEIPHKAIEREEDSGRKARGRKPKPYEQMVTLQKTAKAQQEAKKPSASLTLTHPIFETFTLPTVPVHRGAPRVPKAAEPHPLTPAP